jgi:hypothetical protein
VDTVVVRDSREAAAYHVARQRLRLIAATMVAEDRFEATFARVMCLVSPQELGDVIAAGPTLPLAAADRERLAGLVQAGFREWSAFNERFGAAQRHVRQLDAGLAGWGDVYQLLTAYGGAAPAEGFAATRFAAVGDGVEAAAESARVARMPDGAALACGDYAGSPVFGATGEAARQTGLNRGPAPALLRQLAFPHGTVGPAHLRWPTGTEPPPGFPPPPWGVLVTMRQSVRADPTLGWVEQGQRLDCFRVTAGEPACPVEGEAKELLLRGLWDAVVRNKPEVAPSLVSALATHEAEVVSRLRQPSDGDRDARVSHAVTPLFAAIVAGPA